MSTMIGIGLIAIGAGVGVGLSRLGSGLRDGLRDGMHGFGKDTLDRDAKKRRKDHEELKTLQRETVALLNQVVQTQNAELARMCTIQPAKNQRQ
jgi:hypothetical protein